MGFLDGALELRSYRVQVTNPSNPASWLVALFGGNDTVAGIKVDADTAMTFSAVYSGCRVLAEDVGTLPLPVFRRQGEDGRAKDRSHPAWRLLNVRGNPEMTAAGLRGTLQGHAALRGNAYAEIEWDQVMRARALWPLLPHRMRLMRNGRDIEVAGAPDGQLAYVYTLPTGALKVFAPENILHIRGFSPNGLQGWSVVRLARHGIGLALAAQEYLGRFYVNDGRPGTVLKHKGQLSDNALKHIEDSWSKAHEGLSNAHRVAILEEDMDVASIPMTLDDAQFLESRKFEVTEIARWFRLAPHKLADLERSTNNNIESEGIHHVTEAIRAWCVRWEQELALRNIVAEPWFAEHNMDGLMRGDAASRGTYYGQLRAAGGITPNQIASKENLPQSDDPAADEILIPLNHIPASALDENGMTFKDRMTLAIAAVAKGFEPAATLEALKLPPMAHTGKVPSITVLAPSLDAVADMDEPTGSTDPTEPVEEPAEPTGPDEPQGGSQE